MNIFVSGLVNIETPVSVRGFPINYYPIDYPFFGIGMNVGGVGYNAAKALKTLGDNVTFVSFVGRDITGNIIEETLHNDGIETKYLQRTLNCSAQSVVLVDPSGRRQIYCDLKDIQDRRLDCTPLNNEIQKSDMVVCCNINFNRTLLHEAKRLGKRIATDVHVLSDINDEYNREFLECADIVFLSNEGLPCSPYDFLTALKNQYGMSIIVLGQGSSGAMLYERSSDTITHFDCVPCPQVVNTVGAGDALFSAFVHFYTKGL
ncbi:MAG: carbohydrate kinase family protein, partial [Spirochaetales bacterium]|nr:carbohydrate kinase family protein [Spirochaetales bacterium]